MNMKIKKTQKSVEVKATTVNTDSASHYDDTIDYIVSAIESLSELAKNGDVLARETIANLGVVLLDLK